MDQPDTLDRLPARLLGVWAHPDDEAYLSAGLMARMTDAGRSVTVITATRGEKGTDDERRFGTTAFATHRERELRASLDTVGVRDLRFLGHGDGDCDSSNTSDAVSMIESVMRQVRPSVIVTFGPDGITGHPDHQAVSRWTTEAWRRHGGGQLHYATMTHDYVAEHADLHDRLGTFDEFGLDGPISVAADAVVAAYDLSDAELDRKRQALAAHASQTVGLSAFMGEETYRTWWRTERFRRPTPAELATCPLPRPLGAPFEAAP